MRILRYPDDRLKSLTSSVMVFDKSLADAAYAMRRLMKEEDGAGLAAPQVGIPQSFFVVADYLMSHKVIVNPSWSPSNGTETYMAEEGCLSFPGLFLKIKRFKQIDIYYQDVGGKIYKGKLDGFAAHVFQHESDHLVGTLMIDHLNKGNGVI